MTLGKMGVFLKEARSRPMNDMIILPPPKAEPRAEPELRAPEDFITYEPIRSPRWKTYAAPAGALVLVLGIGWMVAARINDAARAPSPDMIAAQAAADSAAQALNAAQTQRQELAALRNHVECLKAKLDAQAQKSHANEATIATLQKTLAEQRADAAAATSQLQAKIEKVQTLASEKQADHMPVGSIGKPLPKPPLSKPTALNPTAPYRAFVLRDVEDGRAVVEGARGLEDVGPGDVLPGGARVERIERRGPNWIVLTDRGAIAPDGRWDD